MKKDGFTLIEILLVLVIVVTLTASASIVFGQVSENTNEEELKNLYISIQRAAKTYVDLEDGWTRELNNNGKTTVSLVELQNKGYIKKKMINPVDNTEISSSYIVKICVANDDPESNYKEEFNYVDTCILTQENTIGNCVSNSMGLKENCCSKCKN